MVYNTAADVRRVLHLDSSNEVLTDTEINEFLADANKDLYLSIKRRYESNYYQVTRDNKGNLKTSYRLLLTPLISVYKVLKNGSEVTNTNYTVDLNLGEVTFNSGVLEDGDLLEIMYEPTLYSETELYLCAYLINISTQILSSSGQSNLIENIEKKKDELLNYLQSVVMVDKWY